MGNRSVSWKMAICPSKCLALKLQVHQEPSFCRTLGASCFPKFMEQWRSFLRRHCVVLRCFACFIILRGDQTRNPQNKQWTTVWLAAICCSAYAGLLAQCCCLSRPEVAKLFPLMGKKTTKHVPPGGAWKGGGKSQTVSC